MRELSPAAALLDAAVAQVLGSGVPLERRLQLRELKQTYVFSTLLAKKTRVRKGGDTHLGSAANSGMALLGHGH